MTVKIEIEKLVYGGDGLGRLAADEHGRGKAVFVPFVLPGEQVEIELSTQRTGFSRAALKQVVTASPQRVAAPCPHYLRCGGCQLQHASYEAQLESKSSILRETLQRTAKVSLDVPIEVHAAEPWNYRNRTRMKVRARGGFAMGYFRHASHELEAVRECPISSPLINQAIAATWSAAAHVPEALQEVQFFANHDDSKLLVEIYVAEGADPMKFEAFSDALSEALPELVGVAVFHGSAGDDEDAKPVKRPVAAGAFGEASLVFRTAAAKFQVSAGSFFQTNRHLVDTMQNLVVAETSGAKALDLYAGVGLFSVALAKRFGRVTAVEVSPQSFADLEQNATENLQPVRKTTDEFLKGLKRADYDLVVVDPPRAGLGEKTVQSLVGLDVAQLTYVSCDPATLSRDLAILIKSGFRVNQAHLLDLFPQTFHIESIFQLVR
jgi:23S rRNA (uracil1939-C5)-methyltransferase